MKNIREIITAIGLYKAYYNEKGLRDSAGEGWSFFGLQIRDVDKGIYKIIMDASIFFAVVAFLSATALLAISAGGGASSKTFQDAKKWLIRIFVISVLIFGITNLISLIGRTGFDMN